MRQLITRIDDDLHARLKELAEAEGRSVNSLVVTALERLTAGPADPRAVVRRRARDSGVLMVPTPTGAVPERAEVIDSTRGAGVSVGKALAAERDAS